MIRECLGCAHGTWVGLYIEMVRRRDTETLDKSCFVERNQEEAGEGFLANVYCHGTPERVVGLPRLEEC